MEVVSLIDGAYRLEAHFLYKEEDDNHIIHVMICYVLDYMVCLDIYLSLAV